MKNTNIQQNSKKPTKKYDFHWVFFNKFLQDKYPSSQEIKRIAEKFDVKYTKIENWFKHKRSSEFHKGILQFKVGIF